MSIGRRPNRRPESETRIAESVTENRRPRKQNRWLDFQNRWLDFQNRWLRIGDQNRRPESETRIGDQNWRPESETRIGDQVDLEILEYSNCTKPTRIGDQGRWFVVADSDGWSLIQMYSWPSGLTNAWVQQLYQTNPNRWPSGFRNIRV